MDTIQKQIEDIEEVLRKTPHHKATNGFIGLMRAKIARLKDKEIESSSKGKGGGGGGYAVKKQGDATVVLIGPPSAGKSTLINRLTNAESKVAPYAFTTVSVIPGMLKYKSAYIQILDVPGLLEGAKQGRGRGREVLSVARGADLLIIMSDTQRPEVTSNIVKELEGAGIRINQKPPQVLIEKNISGGLEVRSNIRQDFDLEDVKNVAYEYGIKNGEISIKEKISFEKLYDAFSLNRVYIPAIFVINKSDTKPKLKVDNHIHISAENGIGMDSLIEAIWKALKFVTIYLVKPNEDPNFDNPMIMKEGETLKDVLDKIGTDFSQNKKVAKIWGNQAKFPGQEVSFSTKVKDKMQIRFL